MKKIAKSCVVAILNWQVRRLYRKNTFKTVIVSGSVGKTSTKFAIAQLLSVRYKVQYQKGNYNDVVTVPLVFFGLDEPSILNPVAWLKTFAAIERQLKRPYPYEIVVIEVGTDYPGNLSKFKSYLRADLGVVTAVALEHMEFFRDLDAVAQEEFTITDYSDKILANADLCASQYLEPHTDKLMTYAQQTGADYRLTNVSIGQHDCSFDFTYRGAVILTTSYPTIFPVKLYSVCVAASVGHYLSLTADEIGRGIASIESVSGRMNLLKGIKNTLLIDDTYNASPEAVKAALDALYSLQAPQKIAVLGNMNELGDYSQRAHTEVGAYCDPKQLDKVITIGPDANTYLADAATKAGCRVKSFESPYEAGEYVKSIIKEGATILFKGSQNRVFAEEAVKSLLANHEDVNKLVRQSKYWMTVKYKQFGKV